MEYATIEISQHVIEPTGQRYRTYKWIGEKYLPVRIDWSFWNFGEIPFKLKKIDEDYLLGISTYIREDAYLPFGWAFEAKIKLRNIWLWFYYRFIATLNVWGLAKTPHGCIPSWHDIGRK